MTAITEAWINEFVDEYVAPFRARGRDDRALEIETKLREFIRDAQPLLDEFWALGFEIGSFGSLVANPFYRTLANFKRYAPLLVEALHGDWPRNVRRPAADAIASLAGPKSGRQLFDDLLNVYSNDTDDERPGSSPKYFYAQAIKKLATRGDFEMLESLIGKPEPSSGDVFLIQAMGKVSDPRAFDYCRDLLSDLSRTDSPDEVTIWKIDAAIYALGAMHDERAIPLIKPFREHSDPDVRDQARKALKKIERAVLRAAERTRTAAVEDPDSNVVGFPDRQH